MTEQILRNELVETRRELDEVLERLNEASRNLQHLEQQQQQSPSTRLAMEEEEVEGAAAAPEKANASAPPNNGQLVERAAELRTETELEESQDVSLSFDFLLSCFVGCCRVAL